MNDFANSISGLYRRFFLRDLLTYIVPGMLVLAPLAIAFPRLSLIMLSHASFVTVLLVVATSYVLGAGLLGLCNALGFFEYYLGERKELREKNDRPLL